ncbi:hypothetical protein DM793_18525 [Paenarthrobacter nitroguajacolicus]|uniref:hypothetical protein n=1 Tax=Paenarthrobacter nitroguajacolicus TaxID=211146 RepID=UPI0015B97A9F|nr:hypothetical protein [Paenarthrobacter nitroguajacolicus]NWL13263.1 hypothetical protein [Paenarthrobacter nitroguajacolicus]
MNDGLVKRAVKQGAKSQPVEHGHGHGAKRARKNAFQFTPALMDDALERARHQRIKDDIKAYAARKRSS